MHFTVYSSFPSMPFSVPLTACVTVERTAPTAMRLAALCASSPSTRPKLSKAVSHSALNAGLHLRHSRFRSAARRSARSLASAQWQGMARWGMRVSQAQHPGQCPQIDSHYQHHPGLWPMMNELHALYN